MRATTTTLSFPFLRAFIERLYPWQWIYRLFHRLFESFLYTPWILSSKIVPRVARARARSSWIKIIVEVFNPSGKEVREVVTFLARDKCFANYRHFRECFYINIGTFRLSRKQKKSRGNTQIINYRLLCEGFLSRR